MPVEVYMPKAEMPTAVCSALTSHFLPYSFSIAFPYLISILGLHFTLISLCLSSPCLVVLFCYFCFLSVCHDFPHYPFVLKLFCSLNCLIFFVIWPFYFSSLFPIVCSQFLNTPFLTISLSTFVHHFFYIL